jgi:hypothetical protein
MSETLVVSSRGVVILEDRGNEVVLKPGIVLEVQPYSDEQVAQWDAEDELSDRERARILNALAATEK